MKAKDYIGKTVEFFSGRVGVVTGIENYNESGDIYLLLDGEQDSLSDAGIDYIKQVLPTVHKLVKQKDKHILTWWENVPGMDKLKLSNKYFNTVPKYINFEQIKKLYEICLIDFEIEEVKSLIKSLKPKCFGENLEKLLVVEDKLKVLTTKRSLISFVRTPFAPTIKDLKNRLFTLTVVRIGSKEKEFQNTEVIGGIFSTKELLKEIGKRIEIGRLRRLIELEYGRCTCFQFNSDEAYRFCYITRVK